MKDFTFQIHLFVFCIIMRLFWSFFIIILVIIDSIVFVESDIVTHGIWAKLVSNWEENLLYIKSQQILSRKRMSMLTGLKVSSLACKCVLYRPERNAKENLMELDFEGLEMQNKIYQWIELKEQIKKWDYLCSYYAQSQSYGY